MRTYASDSAAPTQELDRESGEFSHITGGLTKRELFAAMAMQGLCVIAIPGSHNSDVPIWNSVRAKQAVSMADALIKELNEEKNE